jgi:hypothetical protein
MNVKSVIHRTLTNKQHFSAVCCGKMDGFCHPRAASSVSFVSR